MQPNSFIDGIADARRASELAARMSAERIKHMIRHTYQRRAEHYRRNSPAAAIELDNQMLAIRFAAYRIATKQEKQQ